jgi:hypothetical protein
MLLACATFPPAANAQGSRQVVARYASTGALQAVAFVDGAGGVDDALLGAFASALQNLTLTLYSDDRFDLNSGPGRFVVSFVGGRVGVTADATRFLHFGASPTLPLADTLDGVLYPQQPDPNALPPRLSLSLVQVNVASRVRITWHAVVALRALPVP